MPSKCPKSKHYCSSKSMEYRMGAAVCQKNDGYIYLDNIYRRLNISPSYKKGKLRKLKDKKKIKKRLFESSYEGKKKRKMNRLKKSARAKAIDNREGISYQSNIGLSFLPQEPPDEDVFYDFDPNNQGLQNYKIVYFDIETTGTRKSDQIIQVNYISSKNHLILNDCLKLIYVF